MIVILLEIKEYETQFITRPSEPVTAVIVPEVGLNSKLAGNTKIKVGDSHGWIGG